MTAETVDAFDLLPAEAASDAVRAVEDAIDAHCHVVGAGLVRLDGEQGPAVVRSLLDLGWQSPAL